MATRRAVPNRFVDSLEASRPFFTGVLGFEVAMETDFMTTFASPDARRVQVSVFTGDPSGMAPAYSVEVADVDVCHARAVDAGHEIVYPLTDEPWGVRRFFVHEPGGAVANILQHRESQ